MKREHYLRGFEYTILHTVKSEEHSSSAHFDKTPLIKIKIDFSKGNFCLVAEWPHLMKLNNVEDHRVASLHTGRVALTMKIHPACAINMQDYSTDGDLLFLRGELIDGAESSPCSGMLIFSRNSYTKNTMENSWFLVFYFYEFSASSEEIKFKLPIYLDTLVFPRNFRFPDPC